MATHSAVPHPAQLHQSFSRAAVARPSAGRRRRYRVRPLALLFFGAADFCAAVGFGDVLLGQAAALWLLGAASLLLAAFAASGE
jgi:hypothetical protein